MFPLNGNSTTTALADGATFTGEWYDVTKHGYSNLVVVGLTDQNGSLYVDFSTDGSNSDETHTYAVVADTTEKQIVTVSARYVRVRFTNSGGSAQTYIRLSASLSDSNLSTSTGGGGGGGASAALQEDGNASLVSIDGKLPALNGYTSSGTITGGGQIVCTTTTHGQNTMGIVCSGTWAGLIAVQGTIDGSTWQLVPIYDYGSRTTQFYISTADNATAAIGGFQTVRLIAVSFTSGTANCYVNINNGISPVPVTSVAPGQFYATVNIRDGNNSAFTKDQKAMSDSLPVVIASDQSSLPVDLPPDASTETTLAALNDKVYSPFQSSTSSVTTSSTAHCALDINNGNTYCVSVTGTFTGLVLFIRGTNDDTNYVPLPIYDYTTLGIAVDISSTGQYAAYAGGWKKLEVYCGSISSGSADVYAFVNQGAPPLMSTVSSLYATVNMRDGSGSAISKGQTTMSDSLPVVLASDQTPINVYSTQLTTLVDEASSTVTYVGEGSAGEAEGAASWRIKKVSVSGSVTSIKWADGDSSFDNVWDDRASLTYT